MTIIQLEYFMAVVNTGSFSAAAAQCFVTQPSLSMQIKNLEQELGAILLDRSKKPVVTTEVGLIVVDSARKALKSFNMVRENVKEAKGDISGVLRLGVIPTIAPYLLPLFVTDFQRRHPKAELEIYEMITSDIVSALNSDAIDAALVSSGSCPSYMNETELFSDRFYAYVSSENDLAERSNIRVEDINPKELVLPSEKHCFRGQVLELLQIKRMGRSQYNFEGGSIDTIMRFVDRTSLMTIIPEMALKFLPSDRRKSQVKTLVKGAASRKIALVVRRSYIKSSIVAVLKEAVLRVVPKI